jgi:hypothetical protein
LRHWLNTTLAKAWDTWVSFVEWRREKRKIVQRWMQPMMVSKAGGGGGAGRGEAMQCRSS